MLQPKKTTYRKYQKKLKDNKKENNSDLVFGQYGVKALEGGYITAKTLETIRQTLKKVFKSKVWVRVFPDIPRTKKPSEVRMGKGKGSVAFWVAKISSGQILFEISSLSLKSPVATSRFIPKLPTSTGLDHLRLTPCVLQGKTSNQATSTSTAYSSLGGVGLVYPSSQAFELARRKSPIPIQFSQREK